jgi:hypothetical protein
MPLILIAASLAAAVIHFALGPEHLEELGALGLGFYVAGALQLGWAVLALAAARTGARSWLTRTVVPVGIVLNVSITLAWVVSRTVGLPAGEQPWTPEAIGIPDAISALLEAGIVAGLFAESARRPVRAVSRSRGRARLALVGVASMLVLIGVATVTAVGAHESHDAMDHQPGQMDAAEMEMHVH